MEKIFVTSNAGGLRLTVCPNALTPSRLLRLSKNLPHDWKEQRCFLGKIQPKRSTSDDSKTASRDPAAVRAPHPDIWRLWLPPMRSPGS